MLRDYERETKSAEGNKEKVHGDGRRSIRHGGRHEADTRQRITRHYTDTTQRFLVCTCEKVVSVHSLVPFVPGNVSGSS